MFSTREAHEFKRVHICVHGWMSGTMKLFVLLRVKELVSLCPQYCAFTTDSLSGSMHLLFTILCSLASLLFPLLYVQTKPRSKPVLLSHIGSNL